MAAKDEAVKTAKRTLRQIMDDLPGEIVSQGLVEGAKRALVATSESKAKRRLTEMEKAGLVRTHVDHLFITEHIWPRLEERLAQSAGRFSRQAVERIVMAAIYEYVSNKVGAEMSIEPTKPEQYKAIRERLTSLETAAQNDAHWLRTIDRLSDGQGLISEGVHAITHVFEEPPPAPLTDAVTRLAARGQQLRTRRGILRRLL